jgi:prevent-host-death family protein
MWMYIGGPMSRAWSIAEARDRLPALVHAAESGEAVTLTRRGRPVAVLISLAEHQRLTRGGADFLTALEALRAKHDLPALDVGGALDDTRDRSAPRDEPWG